MELINNNQVPEGYKKTEVGVIPEDWEVVPLKDLIDADRRITYGIVVPGQHTSNGVPMIRAQDYSRGWVDIEDLYRVSPKIDESYKRSRVIPDDILLTIVGSVGNLAKVPSGFRNTNITQQTARLAFNKKAFADFYFNILQSKLGKNVILNYTKSGVQPSLNLSDVEKFNLPYPPLREQKAIAQTLSDVDALIAALDKHIAKKRNIKTATMQQLLTGKTRLPGLGEGNGYKKSAIGVIPEDWDLDRIASITSISTGSRNTQDRVNDGQYPFFVRSQIVERINSYSFDGEAVLTAGDGVGTGKVFHYINGKFDLHQRVYKISNFKSELNGLYFYKYFSNHFYDRIMSMTAKSSVDSVRMEMIADMLIPLPSPEEQKAIAQVLFDIDTEITVLEKRRAKTQAIKQGMMQELLTGRTRLKIEHPDDPITKNSNG